MQKINDSFHLIDTKAFGREQTVAAYLVEGDVAALVDMGYASSAEVVERELRARNLGRPLKFLVPTHVHLDHAGSVGTLAKRFPDCEVVVQHRGAAHLIDPSSLMWSATRVFGQELIGKMGDLEPVPSVRVRPAADADLLDLGSGVRLELHWAPGHAPHQMLLLEAGTRTMITADAVGLCYPEIPIVIPTTPPPAFDPDIAIETLRKIEQMKPHVLLIPHFGILTQVEDAVTINIERLAEWKNMVASLMAQGATVDGLYDSFIDWVSKESGTASSLLPDYLKMSMRVNAQGFWYYFERLRRSRLKPQ